MFNYNMLPVIFFTICLISVITIYITFKLGLKDAFGKVLIFSLAFIFINGLHSLLIELYFHDLQWKEKMGPFLMLYGPLLYFGIISVRDKKLKRSTILIHITPFAVFFVFFIFSQFNLTDKLPNRWLYLSGAISFLCYAVATFIKAKQVFDQQFRDKLTIFLFGGIFLVFTATLFLVATLSTKMEEDEQSLYLLRVLVYSYLLFFTLVVFNFVVNKLLHKIPVPDQVEQDIQKKDPKYERSILTNEQLIEYQHKLINAMVQDKLFFDTTLSLTSLANHLKIPSHHLTQVFSLQLKKNFYQYTNGLRLEYACELLADASTDLTIEELAIKSGFNSKISFNRQFKNSLGCTPTAYRLNSKMNRFPEKP